MREKLLVFALLSAFLLSVVLPLAADGEDAIDENDFYVSISDSDGHHVKKTIGNGQTETWNIYVVNVSDKYLEISYKTTTDNKDITIEGKPGPMMLGPQGGDIDSSTTGQFSLKVDPYAKDKAEFVSTMTVKVANVADNTDFQEVTLVFDITVNSQYQTSGMYNKFMGFFENDLPEPFNTPIFTMLVSIILWIVIFTFFMRLIIPILATILDKTTPDIDDKEQFERALFHLSIPLIIIMSINQGLMIVGASNEIIASVSALSNVLYIIIGALFIWRLYAFIVASLLKKFEEVDENNTVIDSSLLPLFKMIGKIILSIASISLILGSFGVDLQGILISAGVVSLGITLGAQNVLSQFFSGLVILITRPFKAGDFLKINDKVYVVKKVKVMFTEFTSWENDSKITMPNNVVTASTVHNMTENGLPVKQYVYFTVAYGTDLDKARDIMIETCKKNPLVVEDEKHEGPGFRCTNMLDSGIELRLSYYAKTFDDTSSSAGQIRQAVYKAFRENGIEIPYNRLQIDILSDVSGEKRPDDIVAD